MHAIVVSLLLHACNTNSNVFLCAVYVHNDGYPALYDMTTVIVKVLDVNDNAPIFTASTQVLDLQIPENANMAVIHTVEAYDADLDDNGLISYYIAGYWTVPLLLCLMVDA